MSDNIRLKTQQTEQGEPSTLPAEMRTEAVRRLGWLGLVYAGGYTVAHFGQLWLLRLSGVAVGVHWPHHVIAFLSIAMGIAVFVMVRRAKMPPKRILDYGLVFQVAGAFGVAANEFFMGFPTVTAMTFKGTPAECVWIVIYPLVVVNTPGKILVSSLLAASMGPLVVAVVALTGSGAVADGPMPLAAYFLTNNYMCAVLAYVVARIVHRYGMSLRHAKEIGSYELVELLGEGGMGQVWRARHRLLARPAAIKVIRAELLGSDDRSRDGAIRRFEREARATAVLGSTHTVDVYDFGVTQEGHFYYVMELLNGMSLERFVQLHGPMEPARVAYVLQQVCHSLGEAHGRGMIHRDIKPANIFLCRLGPDSDFIKVLDFGLVKQVGGAVPGSMVTVETATPGTPAYMAPEIALGRPNIDGRADLYSLGCVAYFLLTGRPVFSGDTPMATALAHVKDVPPAPSARSEFHIPPAFDAVVMACLAKDPLDRPESATELALRLTNVVRGNEWTGAAAHAWWNLHRGTAEAIDAAKGPEQVLDATREVCQLRCWPRLDRTPVAQ